MKTRSGVAAAGLIIAIMACEREPVMPEISARPNFWVGCVGSEHFTGGGRVDPWWHGKVTFGFNLHSDDCGEGGLKGQLEVVFHEEQMSIHSLTVAHFASYVDPTFGNCGEWDGQARFKRAGDNRWTEHRYNATACDNGEPGHGVDHFSFYMDDDHFFMEEPLTGGNIQAH